MAKTIEKNKTFMSDQWAENGKDVSDIIRLNALSNDTASAKIIEENTKELANMLRILDKHTKIVDVTPTRLTIWGIRDLSQVYGTLSTEGKFLIMCLTGTKIREPMAVKILYHVLKGDYTKIENGKKKFVTITKGAEIMKKLGVSYSSLAEIRDNKFYLVYDPPGEEEKIMAIPGKYVLSTMCRRANMICPQNPDILDITYLAKRLTDAKDFRMIVRTNSAGTKAVACMGADYQPMKQAEVMDVIEAISKRKKCLVSNWEISHYGTNVDLVFTDSIVNEAYAVGARFSFSDMGRESPSITPYIYYEDGAYPYGERTSMQMDSKFNKFTLVDDFFEENGQALEEMRDLFDNIQCHYLFKVNAKDFITKYLMAVSNANTCKAVFRNDEPIGIYSGYGERKIANLFAREEEQFGPFPEEPVSVVEAVKLMMSLWLKHRDDEEEDGTARIRLNKAISLALMKLGGYKFKKKKK